MDKSEEAEAQEVKFNSASKAQVVYFHRRDSETYSHESSLEEPEESQVLDPDHPLLTRFQKSLKEHLKKQIEHLQSEIFELETGAKKKRLAREQLGVETYEVQQLVNKQQKDLEICIVELDDICKTTEELESQLEKSKEQFSKKRQELYETQKNELHLRNEVEGLNLLIHQVKNWEDDLESDLTINQRVFEKTKKDQIRLADEKRQLDIIIYRLMTEIWRLEEEAETVDMQIKVKEEEREKLAETVAMSNVEIETINAELRSILRGWNSVIILISQRDKDYDETKQELDKLYEKLRSTTSVIEQTKKCCQKEMQQNERLTAIKYRFEADIDTTKRLLEVESRKRATIEMQIDNNQILIDQIENDIQKLSGENIYKAHQLSLAVREYEKATKQKIDLEGDILKTLEDKLTNHKAAKFMHKKVYQISEKNKDLEITLATLENTKAKLLMDIEAEKYVNDETQRFLEELIKQQNNTDILAKNKNAELEKLRFTANKRQRDLDLLTTKIDTIVNKQGGSEMSLEEIKIQTLEKNIAAAKEEIKELQKFWLREQGYVVSLSQQRHEQINDINMVKKQMLLLTQKNLKINDELEAHKILEEKMNRIIINLQNRLVVLSEQLSKKRGNKDMLGKDNNFLQSEYEGKLKDAEMDSIKIESDIADIEEDKAKLTKELIELNTTALSWEKKIQMAVETKKQMDKEQSEGGEIGNMKCEIHRMSVRMSQLKKAQDKLILDLEHCISRREAILTIAEAREKREKGASEKTRINFTRKLDDMRNKITQLESEAKTIESKIEQLEAQEENIKKGTSIAEIDIKNTEIDFDQRCQKIEELKTTAQRNDEILIIKQKKLKMYSELAKNRHPFILYRTESMIKTEYQKVKEVNNHLLDILDNLLSDFPNFQQVLNRMLTTLQLPHIYLPITKQM